MTRVSVESLAADVASVRAEVSGLRALVVSQQRLIDQLVKGLDALDREARTLAATESLGGPIQ